MTAEPLSVYLLHFDQPLGHQQHYLGITRTDRLHRRMEEHQRGRGARLTARLSAQGLGFTLTHIIPDASPEIEKRLKQASRFKRLCPLCSPQLDNGAISGEFPHYPAPVVETRETLGGWGPAGPMFPSRMKTDRQTS